MPDDEGLRERVARAMREGASSRDQVDSWLALADALLPVVERHAARRTAEEFRALAGRLSKCEDAPTDAALEGLDFTLRVLHFRADTLAADGTEPHPAHRHDETETGR